MHEPQPERRSLLIIESFGKTSPRIGHYDRNIQSHWPDSNRHRAGLWAGKGVFTRIGNKLVQEHAVGYSPFEFERCIIADNLHLHASFKP